MEAVLTIVVSRMGRLLEAAGMAPAVSGIWSPPADMHETDDAVIAASSFRPVMDGCLLLPERSRIVKGTERSHERCAPGAWDVT
ncbi:hypothetical protein [Streptomyces sp. NPDC056255]|uniref:hypothetical protein n=1 Tax=Streptomyces sp. NPDC056255 TaxID=3345764 RepID=UPI0035DD8CAC